MSIAIGEVIAVRGTHITVELYEESNKEVFFYKGEKFNGVSIQEFVSISHGLKDIVGIVQGEYLDEKTKNIKTGHYTRKIDLLPIGYFQFDQFHKGIKHLPMIRDIVYLVSDTQVKKIYETSDEKFIIGETLTEELPISLPWKNLFNTHIGIFGNTGSGKSNTLTSLYTTLFNNKLEQLKGKSQFVVIDFNGEYTKNQLISQDTYKKVYNLDIDGQGDKLSLTDDMFWDAELFGILFKATENTQKPFLKRIVIGKKKYGPLSNKEENINLEKYVIKTLESAFTSTVQHPEFISLILEILSFIDSSELEELIKKLSWYAKDKKLYFKEQNGFFNGGIDDNAYNNKLKSYIDDIKIENLSAFDELKLRINTQLLADLIHGYVQFEHIQPLLKRIEASVKSLEYIFDVGEEKPEDFVLTVISLRKTNQEIKKVIPLVLARFYYSKHKKKVINEIPPKHTFHMIIDEAHNILSNQSNRESASWKDYRLELFEEIIKEGRKFGFFLTLSSQRPADISPTIMSQLHNFFIHRLVNDNDLKLLESTISSLDDLSRQMIPNLSKGCAIITGTSFDIPMVVQFNAMAVNERPDSDDIDIGGLWGG